MTTRSKDGWTLEREHDKITLGRKQYRNMEEWSRPCSVCGGKFEIFTRTNGGQLNASFGLRTCKLHRGQRGTAQAPGVALPANELEQLRIENTNLRDECAGHLSYIAELERELAQHRPPTVQQVLQKTLPWGVK